MRLFCFLLGLRLTPAPHYTTYGTAIRAEYQSQCCGVVGTCPMTLDASLLTPGPSPALETIPVWNNVNGLWMGRLHYARPPDTEFPGNYSEYYSLILRRAEGTRYFQKNIFFYRRETGWSGACDCAGVVSTPLSFGHGVFECSPGGGAVKIMPSVHAVQDSPEGSLRPDPDAVCSEAASRVHVLGDLSLACGSEIPNYNFMQSILLAPSTGSMRRTWMDATSLSDYEEFKIDTPLMSAASGVNMTRVNHVLGGSETGAHVVAQVVQLLRAKLNISAAVMNAVLGDETIVSFLSSDNASSALGACDGTTRCLLPPSPPPPPSPPVAPSCPSTDCASNTNVGSSTGLDAGCCCTSGAQCASYECNYSQWRCAPPPSPSPPSSPPPVPPAPPSAPCPPEHRVIAKCARSDCGDCEFLGTDPTNAITSCDYVESFGYCVVGNTPCGRWTCDPMRARTVLWSNLPRNATVVTSPGTILPNATRFLLNASTDGASSSTDDPDDVLTTVTYEGGVQTTVAIAPTAATTALLTELAQSAEAATRVPGMYDVAYIPASLGDDEPIIEGYNPTRPPATGSDGGGARARALGIVGGLMNSADDGRTRVACGDTDAWPFKTVVALDGGARSFCSGTLIAKDTILTAGHCVHCSTGRAGCPAGTWIDFNTISVHPCDADDQNGADRTFEIIRRRTWKGWSESRLWGYDAAVLKVKGRDSDGKLPGELFGWKSFGYSSAMTADWRFNMQGYPGDKPAYEMWHDFDTQVALLPQEIHIRNDLWPGHSGSGLYRYTSSGSPSRVVYGVISFQRNCRGRFPPQPSEDCDLNGAARIRSWMFASICEFIDDADVC